MMTAPLHQLPVKMLGDIVSARSLEKTLQDAALSRGLPPEDLNPATLEEILKREVYKRLLLNVSPGLAKKRIMDVLSEVAKQPTEPAGRSDAQNPVSALEQASKRFTLYFDWPETQRLRGVLGIARAEGEAGRNIAPLVQEGQNLISQMERRLEEGLVLQAQELAELKDVFARVQPIGGKEVRRLESLIGELEEAQKHKTLLPAELERARNISFKLRKTMESSLMQADSVATTPEAQSRMLALEQEHATRKLGAIQRDYAPLLRARPDLEQQQEELRVRQSTGKLSEAAVDAWREALETARQRTLTEQREELAELAELLGQQGNQKLHEARVALDVARMTLQGGGLATEELRELRNVAQALNHSPERAERVLQGQRELEELTRSARDVPGAAAAIAGPLAEARQAIERGEAYDLSALWGQLERHMSAAAAQRQDFDARADFVIAEYDEMRGLAGETIQRLGRLADTLRAQRRLGPMSPEARERYAQTLTDGEALLSEAHAEYEAAQKVTATFGEQALDDLLDVFDFGGDSLEETNAPVQASASNPWSSLSLDEPPARDLEHADLAAPSPATPPPAADPFAGLLGDVPPQTPAPASPVPASPALASVPALRLPGEARADIWQISRGEVTAGTSDAAAQGMAGLLLQAATLGLHRLDMGDATHVWSARSVGGGEWRLARAADWDSLDDDAGPWLDTGEL
ncbi:hypothetical protein WDJ50_10505 [Deinococcus sp. VB142]|uniref:Chromosome segregation ATPase n=1 Tax=Deinococcus sp. VB142 TaxID=3112952 RepID=A0AAU6PZL3_9DEIO